MKLKKIFTLVLVGISGSGKGTQAKFLLRALGKSTQHIQTGKLLRRFTRHTGEGARLIQRIMQEGKLVPPFASSLMWEQVLIGSVKRGKNIIFDGSPRTIEEAKKLDEIVSWLRFAPVRAIYITLTPREVMHRLLLRKRFDDTPAAIRARIHFFRRDVMPVIRYYRKEKRLITINGNQTIEEVWRDIKKVLCI